jgi:hypothetical protein
MMIDEPTGDLRKNVRLTRWWFTRVRGLLATRRA